MWNVLINKKISKLRENLMRKCLFIKNVWFSYNWAYRIYDFSILLFYVSILILTKKKRKLNPIATQSERPPVTRLNSMSFVKIQSGQTDEIQCPPLSMLSLEMHLPWASQFNTPVLRPCLRNISWYIDYEKASCWAKNAQLMVWYCDKLSETPKT